MCSSSSSSIKSIYMIYHCSSSNTSRYFIFSSSWGIYFFSPCSEESSGRNTLSTSSFSIVSLIICKFLILLTLIGPESFDKSVDLKLFLSIKSLEFKLFLYSVDLPVKLLFTFWLPSYCDLGWLNFSWDKEFPSLLEFSLFSS